MSELIFPEGFLWGSATSAFQVEGGCQNHDFYDWALKGQISDGTNPVDAVDFYHRFREDIGLMKEMNHNAARIGLEWARIEPSKGQFNEEALSHYREVVLALRSAGIEPVLTLHHFANPLWFAQKGGWESPNSVSYFRRYAEQVVNKLGDLTTYWVTINEPNVYVTYAYFQGIFPPGKRNYFSAQKARKNLLAAHNWVYGLVHDIYKTNCWSEPKVGAAIHLRTFDPWSNSMLDRLAARTLNYLFNIQFLDPIAAHLDYLGVQYYGGDLVRFPMTTLTNPRLPKNSLGWDIYPEGFYRVIIWAWQRYHLPILVTENGTCDEEDEIRPGFLLRHLAQLHRTISEGVTVLGYLHWSTLDNFELVEGLSRRFGLVYVDHAKPEKPRRIKASGRLFAEIAQKNSISPEQLERYRIR